MAFDEGHIIQKMIYNDNKKAREINVFKVGKGEL